MTDQLFTETDCKIILSQIERRAKYRQQFLKARTDPCKHSMESGFVFDEAIAHFTSMKATQYERFYPNVRNIRFTVLALLPFFGYGYLAWDDRTTRENAIRCGQIKPRDRLFKFQVGPKVKVVRV